MLMNRIEYAVINNPIRAAIQKHFEAKRMLALGGPMNGGLALEIGCGRGVGVELILDMFGAERVEAFDLDPRMLRLAHRRLAKRSDRVKLWRGDAEAIAAECNRYDAVFDFAIIHHIPEWQRAVAEAARVLKPGGRFYAEEVFGRFLNRFPWRPLFYHPRDERFDCRMFCDALVAAGLQVVGVTEMRRDFGWFVAEKPVA